MAQVNPVARYLIRIIFGASLMQGSFPEALHHYRTAAHLCPTRVIHQVEVGRTLLKVQIRACRGTSLRGGLLKNACLMLTPCSLAAPAARPNQECSGGAAELSRDGD